MIDTKELRVGDRVVLSGKTAPRLVLDKWTVGKDTMVLLKGQQGVVYESVSCNQIARIIKTISE